MKVIVNEKYFFTPFTNMWNLVFNILIWFNYIRKFWNINRIRIFINIIFLNKNFFFLFLVSGKWFCNSWIEKPPHDILDNTLLLFFCMTLIQCRYVCTYISYLSLFENLIQYIAAVSSRKIYRFFWFALKPKQYFCCAFPFGP